MLKYFFWITAYSTTFFANYKYQKLLNFIDEFIDATLSCMPETTTIQYCYKQK